MRLTAALLCLAISPVAAEDLPERAIPVLVPAPSVTLPQPRAVIHGRNVFELLPTYVKHSPVPVLVTPPLPASAAIVPPAPAFQPQAYDFTPAASHIEECGIPRAYQTSALVQVGHDVRITDIPPAPASTNKSESEFRAAVQHLQSASKLLAQTGDSSNEKLAKSTQAALGEMLRERAEHHRRLASFYARIAGQHSDSKEWVQPGQPQPRVSPRVRRPGATRSDALPPRQPGTRFDSYSPKAAPGTPARSPLVPLPGPQKPVQPVQPSATLPAGAYDQPPATTSRPVGKAKKPLKQVMVKCQVIGVPVELAEKLHGKLSHSLTRNVLTKLGLQSKEATPIVHCIKAADWTKHLAELRSNKSCKVLAEPTLVTMSGNVCSFLSGGEVPIELVSHTEQIGIEFRSFGTQLLAKPTALSSGKIMLELTPQITTLSRVNSATLNQGQPALTSRRIETNVVVQEGDVIILGGITDEEQATLFAITAEVVEPADALQVPTEVPQPST